jgi:hypothetical protein
MSRARHPRGARPRPWTPNSWPSASIRCSSRCRRTRSDRKNVACARYAGYVEQARGVARAGTIVEGQRGAASATRHGMATSKPALDRRAVKAHVLRPIAARYSRIAAARLQSSTPLAPQAALAPVLARPTGRMRCHCRASQFSGGAWAGPGDGKCHHDRTSRQTAKAPGQGVGGRRGKPAAMR